MMEAGRRSPATTGAEHGAFRKFGDLQNTPIPRSTATNTVRLSVVISALMSKLMTQQGEAANAKPCG